MLLASIFELDLDTCPIFLNYRSDLGPGLDNLLSSYHFGEEAEIISKQVESSCARKSFFTREIIIDFLSIWQAK